MKKIALLTLFVSCAFIFGCTQGQNPEQATITTTSVLDAAFEKQCTSDRDCACGVHINTGDCFYGNRMYVNLSKQCPDYCNGIAAHLAIKCVNSECKQVSNLNNPTTTTTTLAGIQTSTTETTAPIDCQTWYDSIEKDFDDANSCQNDSDCKAIELGGMWVDFGCFKFVNIATDEDKLMGEVQAYSRECARSVDSCAPASNAKCVSNKCITPQEIEATTTTMPAQE